MKTLKINSKDNVLVAIQNIKKGEVVADNIVAIQDIQCGHKIATINIKKGQNIIKYGSVIGKAKCNIKTGEFVHSHNLQSEIGIDDYQYQKVSTVPKRECSQTFFGYPRANGTFGVRNYLYIIPTVGCINYLATNLANKYNQSSYKSVDAVIAVTHQFGCSQLGDDHENTSNILCNIAKNPNCGGVLIVGLGCENNNIQSIKDKLSDVPKNRIEFINAQDCECEITTASEKIEKLILKMAEDEKVETPISNLVIGVKCGGSDGFSGITANPLIGEVCDSITSIGGTVVMTEVPEMFGAEKGILNRCENREIFDKSVAMINDFKRYFVNHNMPINENPSPGNKAGGITTLEEKSLGCTQKSGASEVCDVLSYHQRIKTKGLVLLSAPGNDIVAVSALASAGCNLILFSTGRGTPLGGVVPVVKVSSNQKLATRKSNWIDFDASVVLDGKSHCRQFIEEIIEIANGKKTKSENMQTYDFAIFKNGITL
ncbi:MAG: altronate dehydratase family protein [Bacillota bacterium]